MSDTEEEKFQSFFLAAYLADSLELLPYEMKAKLVHVVDQYGFDESWQKLVENDFGINQEWVRNAFRIFTKILPPDMALKFLMRGFEAVEIDENLALVVGDPADLQDRTAKFQS